LDTVFLKRLTRTGFLYPFGTRKFPLTSNGDFRLIFLGETVGEFIPDLLVFGSIIVDTKVIDQITDHEWGQVLNYLRVTKKRVAPILNFRPARLEWEGLVL
jgi:GxxExxY protein